MGQNDISRFQPLQDAKQALIKEIEKLSSWTEIHPDEPEMNKVFEKEIRNVTKAIRRVEKAVAKYEN